MKQSDLKKILMVINLNFINDNIKNDLITELKNLTGLYYVQDENKRGGIYDYAQIQAIYVKVKKDNPNALICVSLSKNNKVYYNISH